MNSYEIQMWAREFGAELKVDGIIGPITLAAIGQILDKAGHTRRRDSVVAFEQFVMREVGGLATGPIDGIVGPATRKARTHWTRGPWRNGLLDSAPGDERMPKALNRWPKYSELTEFYGEPGQNLVMVSLPFPLRPSWALHQTVYRTRVHAKVADSIVRVQRSILSAYGMPAIRKLHLDIWGGCYSPRPMRGSTRLSTHAWGIAWDTDPLRNALRWDRERAHLARPEYAAFWKAWTDEGWVSLGKARDFDWMHTQACRLG